MIRASQLLVFGAALLFAISAGRAQDRTVVFDVSAPGVVKTIPRWGLDTAWASESNMRRGVIYMGAEQVDLVRVTFPVNAPLDTGVLTSAQLADVAYRVSLANYAGAGKPLTLTTDTGAGVDPWFKNGAEVVPARWVQAMQATVQAFAAQGRTIISASPFNEPDYGWNQGTIQNLYDICGLLGTNPQFTGIALAGGSTLNCDLANTWYNPIKARIQEGTTHQLGGTFNNYVSFYQNVIASGDVPVNEEVHNLVEVIAGAEYGLNTAIWWGTAERARGGFVRASDGVRLGYAEQRAQFTAAAVYRAPGGAVQAFLGSSERQGQSTAYRFFSRDRKVFYDGHGPKRGHTVTIKKDNDLMVNITYGDDVATPVGGRYIVVNRNSRKVLEVAGAGTADGANIQQNAYTGATNQQWDIAPFVNAWGDQSYYSMNAVHSGKAADVANFSFSDGANVQQWSDLSGENQKWYFEYAIDGYFYIRNRWNGKYLEVAGSLGTNGANVRQGSLTSSPGQQWRLLPVGAAYEFIAPAAPTGVVATPNAVSVRLSWNPISATDLAGYTVLRSETAGGGYAIIARDVATTSYIDETARPARTYYYVVKAVDRSLNRSANSPEVSATPTGAATMVARYTFDGRTTDEAGNGNDATTEGAASYGAARVGTGALLLDGVAARAELPPEVAQSDALTFAAWVFWNGGADWQRIFDFGNDTNQYLFLSPKASGAGLRFAIKNGGAEQVLNAPALATGQWVHVAVTLGAGDARLYVNGALVAQSSAVTIKPSDFQPVLNYLGKSQFADPLFSGRLDDVRLYNYAVGASGVAALVAGAPAAPGNVVAVAGPGQIQLSWAAVAGATSYTVSYATSASGPFVELASGLSAPGYTHAGAPYGQTHYYVVTASNLAGVSTVSTAVGAAPQSALLTEAERLSVRVTVAADATAGTVATVVVPGSVAGHLYQLQYCEDLTAGAWIAVGAALVGNGGELSHTFPAKAVAARAFYRVMISR